MTLCYPGCRNHVTHVGTMCLCTYESCDSVCIYHVTLYVWTMWLCTYQLCSSGRMSHVTMAVRTMVLCAYEPCDCTYTPCDPVLMKHVTSVKWAGVVCLISSFILYFIYLFLEKMLKKIAIFPHCCEFVLKICLQKQ